MHTIDDMLEVTLVNALSPDRLRCIARDQLHPQNGVPYGYHLYMRKELSKRWRYLYTVRELARAQNWLDTAVLFPRD